MLRRRHTIDGLDVVVMDSMSQVEPDDAGRVVVAGSNGGYESGRVGVAVRCGFVVLNDAGVGKERAGVVGLDLLSEAGIPAAAVGHDTAEISNGADMWANGVITHVNAPARTIGVRVGDDVPTAVSRYVAGRNAP